MSAETLGEFRYWYTLICRSPKVKGELAAIDGATANEADVAATLAEFDTVWEALSPREQSRLLEILIERIECDGKAGRNRKELQVGHEKPLPTPGRIPQLSRLMALAFRFEQLIRDRDVADQAELASLGHVPRARLTQIKNLLNWRPRSRRRSCSSRERKTGGIW